ncbi:heavy metal translocating P-type ATPase [Thermanaeromonas sp.]|uniref:heavy metal translocating P-type ATPase n=1 Tax=Thermanaeromonas sp. TaxID=2003697 RepID=UPI0026182094|nr:heavy metal translocating P-type ATPase [Thermanaeromonas sp.]
MDCCTCPNGKGLSNAFIVISGILLAIGIIFNEPLKRTPYSVAEYLVLLSAYFLSGWKVLKSAFKNLFRGRVLDENFLMTVSTLGALAIRQLPEAAAVMTFYAIGEYFKERAVNRSRRSIAALLDLRPDYANLKLDGEIKKVRPEEVEVGQLIVVKPGEKVPLDGEVVEGISFVDTSPLTGEPVPRKIKKGDQILAGMINGQGFLIIKVTKPFEQSSIARILELVQKAAENKAPTEQIITTFSRYYTPVVVFGALIVAFLPPLILPEASLKEWVYRALVLLVISCPCALVVSVPLSYACGLGGASRRGILVKGASFLEALAHLHTVAFDKTGTLTRGVFRVTKVVPYNGFREEEVLAAAASAEVYSTHPIAHSIRASYGKEIPLKEIKDFQEIPGLGISAVVEGKRVLVGNDRLLHKEGIPHEICNIEEGTGVHVVLDGIYAGYIIISDEIRPDAKEAILKLKELGIQKTILLTGDQEYEARLVAQKLGLDAYFAELLPEGKVKKVEEIQAALPNRHNQKVAFVGDGLNDAPVIMRSDVGVAMGGLGSDAALQAADVVLMEDTPYKLVTAVTIARGTIRIVKQNIILALSIKALFFVLGTMGVATIWEAVFADVGVALVAILNATRAFNLPTAREPKKTKMLTGTW